ncbi:putative coniferyl aldehyde dehydrogenase [Streptomyces cinereoruber]|uniref:Aldehyde dehydrogenase n=1 Tax=Streptomyces cinereoruber TaxID=67260 RepID=A0AAV4KCU0_9ACTN|nr:aldehyde dehydrogenase family protein [Streptomyces cinereoruber]MBB4161253.1 coniferyl-aldehyde dehydrogenase [Streptomyces cinereoruber]MBY8819790.1 aldehyde dehydrogenase family protein [Streptomyces cinereoruber]NIH63631.1 coniferyl-aldehyde dehydrogenase [Streptomyces cinereoruber]QEV36251.1 aldehyde dehydrogenase family protein [Streptomyces cinereoruber]GGR11629.1 putative coniferyl aldehyde dehydrogenase [Streptomyces cinereoruber]
MSHTTPVGPDHSPGRTSDDAEAIVALRTAFAAQRAAARRDPAPGPDRRRQDLAALAGVITAYRRRIREALSADFAVHPEGFADLVEVLGVAGRAAFAAEHLEEWMAPEPRPAGPGLLGTARIDVVHQPKGVIGLISPWNFPFDLSLGPLADMLAAGNRVIVKPSEYTPACSALLREMVAEAFDPERVTVVTGGLELAREFPTLPWDHLLYTGNPEVGRLVARAAAENLVPTTLELGGKCPAIVHGDSVTAETVAQIVGTKLVKNGQMCVSVDYCLVPRQDTARFVDLVRAHMRERVPGFAASSDCTGIITERHLKRLQGLLEEARARGVEVVEVDGSGTDAATRRMPLTLVVDPPDDLALMREEIFGPILPVKSHDGIEDAVSYVNRGERPLGLYVFAQDGEVAERVLATTVSGGACVNTCAVQSAVPALGFGGIGHSGHGRHHGVDGFREFSNPRGVVRRGRDDLIDVMFPPYGDALDGVVGSVLGAAGAE